VISKTGEEIVVEENSEETTCCDRGCFGSYAIIVAVIVAVVSYEL
jgi:hypothetical protein